MSMNSDELYKKFAASSEHVAIGDGQETKGAIMLFSTTESNLQWHYIDIRL